MHPRYHVRQPADIPKTLLYQTAQEGWSICELKSKHGTLLNGEPLILIRPAQAQDKIGLANIVSAAVFPDPGTGPDARL